MAKRIKPGDVFEVCSDAELMYFSYVCRHENYGDMIRVVVGVFSQRLDVASIEDFRDYYYVFYPATAALKQGLVECVGHSNLLASEPPPSRWRRAFPNPSGVTDTWIVDDPLSDDDGKILRSPLSDEHRRLPIVRIVNHESLMGRIRKGSRPELEG